MTIKQITEPSAAQDQLSDYNGSSMVASSSYTPDQGTDWAVIGLLLVDAATPDDEDAIVAALKGLDSITAVANPRLWGQLPAELLAGETYEAKLHVTVTTGCTAGTANNQWWLQERKHSTAKPPLGKKWIVCNCVLPAALTDQTAVDALESACEAIGGITTAKIMVFGSVPSPATGIVVTVEGRMRIDEIPLED